METISLKLEKHKKLNLDAMHEKLSDSEKEHMIKEIARLHGISKRKTTDEQIHIAGEKVFAMLEKSFKKK